MSAKRSIGETFRRSNVAFSIIAVILALGFTSIVLVVAGAPPLAAFWNIALGAFGSPVEFSDVLVAWVPLLLATAGLVVTFGAGLWNIGVEGQIVLGGVFATWIVRLLAHAHIHPSVILALAVLAGIAGGAIWAALAGILKTYGGVNEIFGGLGLNFVATALNLWLIFGPWKRPGIASMSGTEPFDQRLWMPTVTPASRLSVVTVLIALAAVGIIYLLVDRSYFGLRIRAVGRNPVASRLLGIPTRGYLMTTFLICGAFAGLAGAVQVTAVYHRLIPSISSGYGYLGLLVAMLADYRVLVAAPVAFFFAALNVGSIQLPIVLKLDSSLSGVLQGTLVLFVLAAQGARVRLAARRVARGGAARGHGADGDKSG